MKPTQIAIFISGGGSNMKALVEGFRGRQDASVALIVSNDPAAAGIEWARKENLETAVIDNKPFANDRLAFEAAIEDVMKPLGIQLICLAGFMRILSADFAARWDRKVLNIHPSLLPKYKGLNTHQRVLDAGDKRHGCTVHLVDGELDNGQILGQAEVPVKSGDTQQTLARRVLSQEHKLYPAVVQRFLTGQLDPLHLSFDAETQ